MTLLGLGRCNMLFWVYSADSDFCCVVDALDKNDARFNVVKRINSPHMRKLPHTDDLREVARRKKCGIHVLLQAVPMTDVGYDIYCLS